MNPSSAGNGRQRRARFAGVALPLLLVGVVTACGAVSAPASGPTVESAAPSAPPVQTPRPTPVVDVPVISGSLTAAASTAPVAPVRLRIDDIGVDMPVIPTGVDGDAQMELPEDPAVAGWYRYGPDAESDAGNIVLSAHVDAPQHPIGPLAGLRDLSVGATLAVADERGQTRQYRVESVTYYEKSALPVDDVFARDGASALVVITCGGPFDSATGRYRDNVVVIARPAA